MTESPTGSDRVRPHIQTLTIGAVQVLRLLEAAQPTTGDDALQLARTRARTEQAYRTNLYGSVTMSDVLYAAGQLLSAAELTALQTAAADVAETPYDTLAGEHIGRIL